MKENRVVRAWQWQRQVSSILLRFLVIGFLAWTGLPWMPGNAFSVTVDNLVMKQDTGASPRIKGIPETTVVAGDAYRFPVQIVGGNADPVNVTITCPVWLGLADSMGECSTSVTGEYRTIECSFSRANNENIAIVIQGVPSATYAGILGNTVKIVASNGGFDAMKTFVINVLRGAVYGGRSIFVDDDGDDSNSGLAIETPLRTLAKAVQLAQPGDTIFLREGTYGGVTISKPGEPANWIRMTAYNGETAVIDGAGRDEAVYFYHPTCDPGDSEYQLPCQSFYWELTGLTIRGGNYYAVKIDTPHVVIRSNNLSASAHDIIKLVHTADDVTIIQNEIHDNNATPGSNAQGIDAVGCDRLWVVGNYVHDIPSIGIYVKGNARDAIIENNRVENIYENGIMLGQSTDAYRLTDGPFESYDCIARNNIVLNTEEACFAVSSSKNAAILNNSCYNGATRAHGAIRLTNESEIGTKSEGVTIRNNIIVVSAVRPAVKIGYNSLNTDADLVMDNNLYWSIAGAGSVRFLWEEKGLTGGSGEGVTIDAWQNGTGQDSASIVADPKFTETSTLRLADGSPAIDAGATLSDVMNDYLYTARPQNANYDIGAYEKAESDGTSALEFPTVKGGEEFAWYPYLQAPQGGGLVVMWATNSSGRALLRYRKADESGLWSYVVPREESLPAAVTGLSNDVYQYAAELDQLSSDTKYVYDIFHSGQVLARTVPVKSLPSDPNAEFSFIAIADAGSEYSNVRKLRDIIATKTENGDFKYPHDFIIEVGDLAYNEGSWVNFEQNFFGQLSGKRFMENGTNSILAFRPFFATLGNHDYNNDVANTPAAYLTLLSLPAGSGVPTQEQERYYSFDVNNAHIVALDTNKFTVSDGTAGEAEMLSWLSEDLANTTLPWKIVLFHNSVFSFGAHGTWGDVAVNRRLKQELIPILQQNGVKLALLGHDHMYTRSKKLWLYESGQNAGRIARKADGSIDETLNGIVYVVIGNGSGAEHDRKTQPSTYGDPTWLQQEDDYGEGYDFVAYRNGEPVLYDCNNEAFCNVEVPLEPQERTGFLHVTISGELLLGTAYNINGEILDKFSIDLNGNVTSLP